MLFPSFKERFAIEGLMPERALLRLKRAGISLYAIEKPQKNRILFRIKRKDVQKVFAIYPDMCYNTHSDSPYTLRKQGGDLGARCLQFCKLRVGFCLGALAFAALTLAADDLTLGVEIVGNVAYQREALAVLEENGIRPFALYPEGKADLASAQLLALPSVEFCSVQKQGFWARVELRRAPLSTKGLQKESLYASHSGVVRQIAVLKGTPCKQAGESVAQGERLVGNWQEGADGERRTVEPMARVVLECVYERVFPLGVSEERAFAESYLALELGDRDTIEQKEIAQTAEGAQVRIVYTVTQAVNF